MIKPQLKYDKEVINVYDNSGAKERILNTVVSLLNEKKDVTKITNRQIAEMAGVNSALINYYYQSKENLLYSAVGVCMGNVFEEIIEKSSWDGQPTERLKTMVKAIAEVAFNNYPLAEIAFLYDMKNGSIETNKMILPLLKEIYGDTKTEFDLKIIGFQLIVPIQTAFLHAKEYKKYLMCDIWDMNVRNELLEKMIDNMFNKDNV